MCRGTHVANVAALCDERGGNGCKKGCACCTSERRRVSAGRSRHTRTLFLCTRTAGAEPTCDDKHPPTHVGETATPQNSPPMRRKRQESPHKSIRTSIPPGDAETEQHGHNGPPTHATRQSRGQPSQLRTVGRAKLHRPENMNCALSKATCWTPKRNTPRWRRILWAPPLQ